MIKIGIWKRNKKTNHPRKPVFRFLFSSPPCYLDRQLNSIHTNQTTRARPRYEWCLVRFFDHFLLFSIDGSILAVEVRKKETEEVNITVIILLLMDRYSVKKYSIENISPCHSIFWKHNHLGHCSHHSLALSSLLSRWIATGQNTQYFSANDLRKGKAEGQVVWQHNRKTCL